MSPFWPDFKDWGFFYGINEGDAQNVSANLISSITNSDMRARWTSSGLTGTLQIQSCTRNCPFTPGQPLQIVEEYGDGVYPPGEERGGRSAEGGSLAGKKIVVADDDPDLLELFRLWLSCAGCRVATARDAASTLETARHVRPDAVILDLDLGGDDGAAVAAELSAGERHCKIVALSAAPNDLANERQLSDVVDARWSKPISRTELLS